MYVLAASPSDFVRNSPRTQKHIFRRRREQSRFADRPLCCRFNTTFTNPPPRYTASDDPKRLRKSCGNCHLGVSTSSYKDHQIKPHSEVLFHCNHCNVYLDRKELALHTSAHYAVHNTGDGDKEANRRAKKTKKMKNSRDRSDVSVDVGESKTSLSIQIVERSTKKAARDGTTATEVAEQNEFSDHSDVEYFGRLPESVFQAIEDTQESRCRSDGPRSPNVREDVTADTQTRGDSESPPPIATGKFKKPRTCPVCSKVYTAPSSYFYHLKSHRPIEHECKVCGKKLGSKATLVQHAAVHSTERRFECIECGKRFRSRASLYIHSESHTDNKYFACDQCESSFRWRTHLLRHLKRHTADKPHVCATCGRGFTVRYDLLRHSRTHSAESHTCEKCNATFAQRRYLKVHMMKKHSIAISGSEVKPS